MPGSASLAAMLTARLAGLAILAARCAASRVCSPQCPRVTLRSQRNSPLRLSVRCGRRWPSHSSSFRFHSQGGPAPCVSRCSHLRVVLQTSKKRRRRTSRTVLTAALVSSISAWDGLRIEACTPAFALASFARTCYLRFCMVLNP